jgi:hypothetical protein
MPAESSPNKPDHNTGPLMPPVAKNTTSVTAQSSARVSGRCQRMRRLRIASSDIKIFHNAAASSAPIAAGVSVPVSAMVTVMPNSTSHRKDTANQSAGKGS